MKKAFWVWGLAIAMAFQACTSISESEQAGINAVQAQYGTVAYSKDKVGGEKLIAIKLENLPAPYDLTNNFDIAAHHIAVLMYQHLNKLEREAYDGIRLEVKDADGVKAANMYFPLVRFMYRSFIEARREVGYIYNKKYGKFVEKFQPGVQENFPADSLALVMDTVYQQTGPVNEPVFMGIDTIQYKENIYGRYLFVATTKESAGSSGILYSLVYKINSNRAAYGYAIYRWDEDDTFLGHNWDRHLILAQTGLD